MKKGFVWAGVLAVSMVASGVTAYTVTKAADKDSYTPAESFASNVGTHFTAYEEGGYPDLTYAAENAVKGVVNIVNTQEISSREVIAADTATTAASNSSSTCSAFREASTGNSRSNSRGRRSAKAADRASSSVRTAIS